MKRLDKLILKSFIGPFVLTTVVSTFILLIQYMLKYFDDFVGKDLGFNVFAELIFYFSINMLPVALPLGVLLSSLMTFGNLGEHFELTAIKSSGISLLRALRPIFIFVIFLSIGAFHFSNTVVPAANLEAYRLLFDIKKKKPGLDIREGQFYDGIEGYSIKVKEKLSDNKTLKDVIIYDHTDKSQRGNNRVILSDSSIMYTILNERYLKFELYNGHYYSEIPKGRRSKKEFNQFVRNEFQKMEMIFSLAGFDMKTTDAELFQNNRQMKNIKELTRDIDSLNREVHQARVQNYYTTLGYHDYYQKDELKVIRDSVSAMNQKKAEEKRKQEELEKGKEDESKKDSVNVSKASIFSLFETIYEELNTQQDTVKPKRDLKRQVDIEQKKAVARRQREIEARQQIKKKQDQQLPRKFEQGNEPVLSKDKLDRAKDELIDTTETNYALDKKSKPEPKPKAKSDRFIKLDTALYSLTKDTLDAYFEKRIGAESQMLSSALSTARNIKNGYTNAKTKMRNYQKNVYKFTVEKNKKYSQSFACLVMFLIGAPLGAIIKRGGLGVPVIVSIFFFISYYVMTITSHKWAKEGFVDGRYAVWYSNMVLFPIGLFFLNKARIDARLFDVDIYLIWFDKLKTRFQKKRA